MISYDDFRKIEIRVGKIVKAEPFPQAKNPSYLIEISFGDVVKKSIAQVTNYDTRKLIGKQVLAVTNLKPKQIADTMSEVLLLGVPGGDQDVILISPDQKVPLGGRLF